MTRGKPSDQLLDRLASTRLTPEERAAIISEVSDRLAAAEAERHQLMAYQETVHELEAKLRDLSAYMTKLQADQEMHQVARRTVERRLAMAERQLAEAAQAAEMHKDRASQVTAALAQAREDLALTRAREAALAERVRTRQAVPDAGGHDGLRPDPLSAGTAAELIGVLRQFRTWAGNPSYRDMALRSGQRAGASTMCTLLGGTELPGRLEVIDAIVEGCGGTDEDRQRFATAWRKLAMPGLSAVDPGPRLHAVRTAVDDKPGDGKTRRVVRRTG
ncbi:MAG TPA: hypothetical protein VFQ68_19060 [Streptosporangiaceae bacterium]|nr:hypothetical protein [Streptosporangiaceae bacterium]